MEVKQLIKGDSDRSPSLPLTEVNLIKLKTSIKYGSLLKNYQMLLIAPREATLHSILLGGELVRIIICRRWIKATSIDKTFPELMSQGIDC
ncbi:hypothetical protein [Candidatus Ichthyocystis hellenicum]|uniref:hypothetical protein n=1 Tax=Candidatus Ichthyocystis hellenicum TaxID=1561003 RepID=UPI000B8A1B01|nr:hypothetical protein [Candidatus Ichthyocystis hellenicum]